MEIARKPPYPILAKWELATANYTYSVVVEDLVDQSIEELEITSNNEGTVTYSISIDKLQYDRELMVKFFDTAKENLIYEESLDIVRQYVDTDKLGTTASEKLEYKYLEMLARSIIDTQIRDGFYNKKHVIQASGSGSDYLPVWVKSNKVLKVYENNAVAYDHLDNPEGAYEYLVSMDGSSIYRTEYDSYNRAESMPIAFPSNSGRIAFYGYGNIAFPSSYDYTFVVDSGYKTVPADVEAATQLLMEDIKCGKLDYYKRYVTSYNTDQFKIQFDKAVFDGTGNLLVDKILDKYRNDINMIGII